MLGAEVKHSFSMVQSSRPPASPKPVYCRPSDPDDSVEGPWPNIGTPPVPPIRGDYLSQILGVLMGFFVGVVQSSFFEWAFHRYWLHRPWLPKECFTQHALIHH